MYLLASATLDSRTIKIWNVNTGECINTITLETGMFMSLCFSYDTNLIISAMNNNKIMVWNTYTCELIHTLEGHRSCINSVAFSNDDSLIVSGSNDKTIKIWNVESGQCLNTLSGHTYSINSVSISNDGTRIVSGSYDKTIRICDVITGECLKILTNEDPIWSVLFNFNDSKLVLKSSSVTTGYKSYKVLDLETDEILNTLNLENKSTSRQKDFSVYFDSFLTALTKSDWSSGQLDFTIKIFDIETGEQVNTLIGNNKLIMSISFNSDNKLLASGDFKGIVKIWNLETNECIHILEGHTDSIRCLCFTHNQIGSYI